MKEFQPTRLYYENVYESRGIKNFHNCNSSGVGHISKVRERERFRQISYAGMACFLTVMGKGLAGYREAMEALVERIGKEKQQSEAIEDVI